jgi:hypothetical protein
METNNEWNDWVPLNLKIDYKLPAVYEIRLKNLNKGIQRWLKEDSEGILCIGKTKNLNKRRKQFIASLSKKSQHSEARTLVVIFNESNNFKNKYSLNLEDLHKNLEIRYRKYDTNSKATQGEKERLNQYILDHGETPPLNLNIPGRKKDGWTLLLSTDLKE